MNDVVICGAAMTRFGKHLEKSARVLVEEAVREALIDADVQPHDVQAAYVGNAVGGFMSGQESIRGQVVLRYTGLMGTPIINVENACASSSTALHLGWQAVASGMYDCVVVVGYEKLYDQDKTKSLRAFNASMDLEELAERFGPNAGQTRSVFMDLYVTEGQTFGAGMLDPEVLGLIAVKNHHHAAYNPYAQYQQEITLDQVLHARTIVDPLTLLMCSPLSDGAACLVLCNERFQQRRSDAKVKIAASVLTSGRGDDTMQPTCVERAVTRAYQIAQVGPEDLDVVELHDATTLAELHLYEELGFCGPGEAPRLVHDRVTWLGGPLPVNPSGGLLGRGHPIGATGAAQVVELVWQLEGRCSARQVPEARVALAENAGGWVGSDAAVCAVHILSL